MMVDKVVDNNESKIQSKVNLHGEFILRTQQLQAFVLFGGITPQTLLKRINLKIFLYSLNENYILTLNSLILWG